MNTCLLHHEINFTTTTCLSCNGAMIKHGYTKGGNPRRKCINCGKTRVNNYKYNAYATNTNKMIVLLTKEGLGIRSTSRVLQISATTLLKKLVRIADSIPRPVISKNKVYEVDELCTYIKRKSRLIWVVYALERETKAVVSFTVGSRTFSSLYYEKSLEKTLLIFFRHYPTKASVF